MICEDIEGGVDGYEEKVSQGTLPIVGKMIVILWGEQNFHSLVSCTARRSKYQGIKKHPLPTLGQTPCALCLIPVTAVTTGLAGSLPTHRQPPRPRLTCPFYWVGTYVMFTPTVLNITHGMKISNRHIPGYSVSVSIFSIC